MLRISKREKIVLCFLQSVELAICFLPMDDSKVTLWPSEDTYCTGKEGCFGCLFRVTVILVQVVVQFQCQGIIIVSDDLQYLSTRQIQPRFTIPQRARESQATWFSVNGLFWLLETASTLVLKWWMISLGKVDMREGSAGWGCPYLILVKLLISFNADSLNSLSLFAYRQATMLRGNESRAGRFVYRRRIDCRIQDGIAPSHRTLRRRPRVFLGRCHRMWWRDWKCWQFSMPIEKDHDALSVEIRSFEEISREWSMLNKASNVVVHS